MVGVVVLSVKNGEIVLTDKIRLKKSLFYVKIK